MKINEITDKNLVWKTLMEIDLNFDAEFERVLQYVTVVLRVKHKNKFDQALQYIEQFNHRAIEFLEAKPFDPTDQELVLLQERVTNMVEQLNQLAKQLN
jgi:hypothetical protein